MENEARLLNSEYTRLSHEKQATDIQIKENKEKIKQNKQLPFLVGNVVESKSFYPDPPPTAATASHTHLAVFNTNQLTRRKGLCLQ